MDDTVSDAFALKVSYALEQVDTYVNLGIIVCGILIMLQAAILVSLWGNRR